MRDFRVKSSLMLRGTVRQDVGEFRDKRGRFLRKAVVDHVMAEIARIVAREVFERIPEGDGRTSYSSLRTLWAEWATQPVVSENVVQIGNVAAMDKATRGPNNMTSKKGTWRYGAWFNLEWGREWPHTGGDTYLYQENPGPNTSPQQSRPPGAGPADIDMRKWIRRTPGSYGGAATYSTRQNRKLSRKRDRHAELQASYNAELEAYLGSGSRRGRRPPKKTMGQFAVAPIRLGYIAGIQIVEKRLPELIKEAIKEAERQGR